MLPSPTPTPAANPNERPLEIIAPFELETDPAHETPEERATRHLRLCQEMIERTTILARAASDRALQDIDPPELETRMPGSAAAALAHAQERARRRVPNNALVFARLVRALRQTMALQAFIAAGYPPPRAPQPPNPDRTPRPAATGQAPPRPPDAGLHCDATDSPDWLPTFDPDSRTPVEDLLHKIAQSIDRAHTAPPPAPPPADTPPPAAAPRGSQPKRRPPAGAAPPAPSRRPPVQHDADG